VKENKEYFEASKIIYLFIYLFYLDPEFKKIIKIFDTHVLKTAPILQ